MDRGEKRALWIAGAGHLALVGFLSVGILSTSRKLPPVDDVMPVDLVDIAAVPSTPRPAPRPAPRQGPDETPAATAAPAAQPPAPHPAPGPARPDERRGGNGGAGRGEPGVRRLSH